MEPKRHGLRWLLVVAACFPLASVNAWAENWPHWRGPAYNGSSAETGLPAEWSKTENVAWSVPLPGPSGATPVIWDNYVFVSSTDLKNQALLVVAVDRKTGSVLWQRQIASGIRRDERTTLANPSPSTDGKRVIFFYGNGELVAFDFQGVKLWSRNIETDYGQFAFLWAFSSTPLLFGNVLYLQVLHATSQ
jgi:outer membrane protein assembly factor BamB